MIDFDKRLDDLCIAYAKNPSTILMSSINLHLYILGISISGQDYVIEYQKKFDREDNEK